MTPEAGIEHRHPSLIFVTTSLARAGAETQVKDLACEHARRGAVVTVVSMLKPTAFMDELAGAGVRVVSLGMRRGTADLRGIVRLARAVREFRPDVVHSHMVHANILSRVTRLFCRMSVLICTAHNIDEGGWWRERMYQLTDRLADVTTNVSQAGVDRYIRIGAVPRGRIRRMPNGIDVTRFDRNRARHELLRTSLGFPGCFVFLAAARLERAKGIDILLAALALLRERHVRLVVFIAGDGSQRTRLEAQASALGLGADDVRFLGVRSDIPDLMEAADALVLPSRWEGLGLVVLEAEASLLPVVAAAVGGTPEIMQDGETGFLVPPDEPKALAQAMERVAALTPGERSAMGRNGRRVVEEGYSLPEVVDRWKALYAEFTVRKRKRRLDRIA